MTTYLSRIEVRRRWRSVLLLAALIALVTATVLTAWAGGRRSQSAFDRMLDAYNAIDLSVFGPEDSVEALGDMPHVEAAAQTNVLAAVPAGTSDDRFYPLMASLDGSVPYDYLRARVVRGRIPDRSDPDAVALSERVASSLGLDVGDTLELASFAPSQMEAFNESGGDGIEPEGPSVALEVVGVVREPGDLGQRPDDIALTWLTPAFAERYADEMGSFGRGALVALDDEPDAMREFGSAVRDRYPDLELDPGLNAAEMRRTIDPVASAIGTGLLVFGLVAAIAGVVAIAQASSRTALTAARDDATLAAVGVGSSGRLARLAAPTVAAGALGIPIGIVASVLASPLHPIGVARDADPDLGFAIDWFVVAIGAAVAVTTVLAVALSGAVLARRRATSGADERASRTAAAAAQSGAPITVTTGLHFALRRGRAATAVPLRATVTGVAAGVLGVLAAIVFAASTDKLLKTPALYGWGWDAVVEGDDNSDLNDGALDTLDLVEDDQLAGVAKVVFRIETDASGDTEYTTAIDDYKGHLGPVMISGREPTGDDEVALGSRTSERLGAGIGDTVDLATEGHEPATFEVTGITAFPTTSDGGLSVEGIAMRLEGARRMGWTSCEDASCYGARALAVADGVAPTTIAERYNDPDADVAVLLPRPPAEVDRVREVERLPWILSVFLCAIAVIAVLHAVIVTVRRRRHDLAILRTVGMTARDVRAVLFVQISALVLAGATIGVLLGILVGRQVWRLVTESISMPFVPTLPLAAVVVVPIITLLLAQLAATIPRRAASRLRPAELLRAE
jgi:hypothetical protein